MIFLYKGYESLSNKFYIYTITILSYFMYVYYKDLLCYCRIEGIKNVKY